MGRRIAQKTIQKWHEKMAKMIFMLLNCLPAGHGAAQHPAVLGVAPARPGPAAGRGELSLQTAAPRLSVVPDVEAAVIGGELLLEAGAADEVHPRLALRGHPSAVRLGAR